MRVSAAYVSIWKCISTWKFVDLTACRQRLLLIRRKQTIDEHFGWVGSWQLSLPTFLFVLCFVRLSRSCCVALFSVCVYVAPSTVAASAASVFPFRSAPLLSSSKRFWTTNVEVERVRPKTRIGAQRYELGENRGAGRSNGGNRGNSH